MVATIYSRDRSPGLPARIYQGQRARELPAAALVDQSPQTTLSSDTQNIVNAITNGDYSYVAAADPAQVSQAINYIVTYGDTTTYDSLTHYINDYTTSTGDTSYLNQLQQLTNNLQSGVASDPNYIGRSYVVDKMKYSNFTVINGVTQNSISFKALIQPNAGVRRTFLLIVNEDAAIPMRINFGADASANVGLFINFGGSILLDAEVAQDDIYIFAAGAINYSITYANKADFVGI